MSLESTPMTPRRRPVDAPLDKPLRDRIEHANLDRPGAVLHPCASAARRVATALAGKRSHP